ncbi:beta-ketoacyl synthase domain-containing protein [Coniochaeta ligniaria NRRL 30616]|uniref:Beta-ketoacyl synthase domain-containing protein n=1 Tax=Coniochaeta ligniaria NRRL 30616 TaxID=1408157 RepID=A0A1J7IHG5_9PEZI|nr:beta-ketoacyl synthase domain-containing protein [Coniochaeta ligniaria NRRL 30616]
MARPESRIAVIGMACRLPGGADSPESLWSLLAEGRDGRKEVPRDRWDWKSFHNKNPGNKDTTNFSHAYFLDEDVSAFDARFFNISGVDAATIDPQQRFLIEVTYEALENAGLPIESLRGSDTSVHMAMFARDYDRMGYRDMNLVDTSHIIGSGEAILANRISYVLDLKGSSSTVDTGCSGGLVALHQACQTLRADEATVALAGASQLLLSPDQSTAMSPLTNKDGRSYTFDDRGAGYARGEGLGVLVLKRLDRAVADGDHIHAVIVESGVGHDGKTAGIFLPNGDAQEALSRSVYARAGLDPRETLFVESHGTGTVAGDNAEVGSIARVFGREAGRISVLPIGSIKTNIGHLEAVSGVAGAIKAIMVLKKNQIPPQLNFINPKSSLRLRERGLKVPLELTPLTPPGHTGPRRVSVNSFGYGGTNAHAILEAYESEPSPTNGDINGNGHVNGNGHDHDHGAEPKLIVLSANSESSLTRLVSNLQQWLASDQGRSTSFADLAYTLNTRRSKLSWRCSVVSSNSQELEEALGDAAKPVRAVKSARDVGLAFVFTGQGAQWFAMGRELLTDSNSQEFASSIALCSQTIKSLGCEWDLVVELSRDEGSSPLGEARFAQPITTAVQIALVDLLAATYGIRPQAVCGHSSGEIAAAYAAGALTKEAAMRVAYMRGVYSAKAKAANATPGGMLAVGEGESAINRRIKQLGSTGSGKVTVACVNSPESTTVSGDVAALLELQAALGAASVFNRRLKVDSAYHSHHMEVVAPSYLASLGGLTHGSPREDVAFYSSVTGARKHSGFGPSYWVSNLVSQVKFSAASQSVAQHLSNAHPTDANNVLIEVGPHAALSGPLRQSLSESNFKLASGVSFKYNYAPCLVRNTSAIRTVLALAGKVFESGSPVRLDGGESASRSSSRRHRVVGDLPSYPWDHSNTYWRESRLSKGNRLRPYPPHDLLGLFDVASSPYEPRWRYHVSLANIPWLRDHVVEGFVIFPGAGYLIMVIEAMKQLFQLRRTPGRITNINFRDAVFAQPVVIHDDGAKDSEEVELQLIISPSRQHAGSPWEYFRVVSYDSQNDPWIDNCSGLVSWDSVATTEPSTANSPTDEFVGARDDGLGHLTKAAADKWLLEVQALCPTSVDAAETYRHLKAAGNDYGDTFQGLKEIHVGKGYATAKIVIQDITQHIPGHYMQPHTIHPSTFDSIFQLEPVCFRREGLVAPIMPAMLGEISVAVDMDSAPGTEIVVALRHVQQTPRDATFSYCAYQKRSDGTFRPVVTGTDIRTQVVGEADSSHAAQKKMTYRMEWKPDVDYITQDDFMGQAASDDLSDGDHGEEASDQTAEAQLRLNNKVATIFIRRAVQRAREQGISTACSPYLSSLLTWMIKWDTTEAGRLLEGLSAQDETNLVEQAAIRSNNIVGLALSRLGPHYLDILTGKADASELLTHDNLLERLYSEHVLFTSHHAQAATYMRALVHKSPNPNVLVIGGGTGGAALPLIQTMERSNGSRLPVDMYTCTEASTDLLERARSRFDDRWAAPIGFKTFDPSHDPLAQGYAAQSFDLVVASMVSYAAARTDATVARLRKLLRLGTGRLMLVELTAVAAAHTAVFGTLDGWWASEDEQRQDGPLMSVPEWDVCLRRNGFSGADLAIPAHKGGLSDASTLIVARAVPVAGETSNGHHPRVSERPLVARVHLGYSDDTTQVAIGDAMCRALGNKGIQCSRESWRDQDPDSLAIVIDSAEHPLLVEPSPETFEQVKKLLLQGGSILWVSFQSSPQSAAKAALKNMVNGMARVLRRENPGLRLVTVDVQDPVSPGSDNVGLQHLIQKLTEITTLSFFRSPEVIGATEHEHAIRNGTVTIPRVIPDDHLATHIDSRNNPEQNNTSIDAALVDCQYLDRNRALKFDVQVPGLLKTIRFVDNDDMSDQLGPDEIQVEARAHGVNFKDVFIALGQMAPGTQMTGEVAGVVTAVGSNVQSWQAGDRVAALFVTPFGNQVRVNSKHAVAIPDSVTFAEAASVPLVFFTAWYCLHHVARVEKGQSVLIHAGSGGVGQAAIQLAQLVGAEVFATVGSAAKRKLIQERYGIPDSRIFSSHSGMFKKQILDATRGGDGVDVVLNSLSGQLLRDSWDCLAPFGTFCEIGKADILGRGQLGMAKFDKQATFAAVDVTYMHRMRPEVVMRGVRDIFAMVDRGLLRPVYPVTTFDMSRIEEAFHLMAERKHMGKLVLVADEETRVQATRPKAPVLRLQREGTYVIGGGLGDLGKRMGRFLAEQGAGHIVALTRRDAEAVARQPAVVELQEAISDLGGTLHIVQCDISDERSARGAADKMADLGLPPVRGVIQSATVLRDHPLEFMELDDWRDSVRPKVQGTLNMHEAFCSPETTDFFVMLSSVASIVGSASQSNYAAGNAFLDAFALAGKQCPRGVTKYATINVGAVEGSELVAGAMQQGSDVTRTIGSVSFADVLAALEYAINPQARGNHEAVQHLMHFNRDTMEDAFGPSALSDRMYDHVPSRRRQGGKTTNNSGAESKKQSVLQVVEQAETTAEAEGIVKQALLDKFTAFIGNDVPDVPIAALGLDSLVSIELKNWVKHTFRTPLQISELSGAQSMLALAKVIVSRMNLKTNKVNGASLDDNDQSRQGGALPEGRAGSQPAAAATVNGTEVASTPAGHGQNCCKLCKELPVQPLPDLDDTLDYWLEANEHLFSPQQLQAIHLDIQTMRAPDSPAHKILRDLYDTHAHDETNGWFTDIVTDARFLCRRAPIAPWTSIMVAQRDGPPGKRRHSQVERAATITSAALSYRRAMDAGEVEPLRIAGRPECTWAWAWLFNSTRVPQLGCDRVVSYAPSPGDRGARDHVAVLRKGRVFKVMLQDADGKDVSSRQLQVAFDAILERVDDAGVLSGLLTTDERDSWAQTRETLLAIDPSNVEYLHVLDSAMFVLCLDAGSPDTPDEIARHGYIGDGANRWFDKVLQFYVSANGRSGLITEHGILDGTAAAGLLDSISNAIKADAAAGSTGHNGHQPSNGHSSSSVELNEVVLKMTPEIDRHATALRKRYQQATSRSTYVREQLDEFGTDFLLQSRVPVKGAIDATFQLALRLFFGQNMSSWEPTSGAVFHAGRADAMQRATPAVNAFCDAAAGVYTEVQGGDEQSAANRGTRDQLRALLLAATKSLNAGMQTLLAGRGSQRVFEVLAYLWPTTTDDGGGAPKPDFLGDMVFFGRPGPPIFAQTNSLEGEMTVEDFVHLMPDADGFWSFISPEKEKISVSLTGGSQERTAAFVKELHRAARIMRDIVREPSLI